MNNSDKKTKMLKRVELGKCVLKKRFEGILNQLGVYEVEPQDYAKLQKLIFLAERYFEKHGINDRDINKLPQKLREMLVATFYKAVNKRVSMLSEESKIFFMIDMHSKHVKIVDKIETVNVYDVIDRWTQHIMLCVVSGYMGTGKTDFSLKMGEWLWLKDTRYIIGNIGVNIKDSIYSPYYFEVATLSELLKIIYRYKDSNKAFIFDEASIHISHRRAMSSKNNAITHLVKLIRKLKCHFVIISQRAEGIDKDLRELMTLHIHKESKTRALVREMFGEKPETYYIDCIEKTKIHFDTLDTADFEIDILSEDIPKIMHLISKNPSYEEFEQYIDELVKKKEEKDKKPNEYINRNNGKDENIQYNNTYQCDKRTDIEDKILTCLYMSDDGKKLRDIMKLIEKSKTRTHEILDSLKKKGLITLEGVGRQSKWIITDAGKYHVEKHLPHAN